MNEEKLGALYSKHSTETVTKKNKPVCVEWWEVGRLVEGDVGTLVIVGDGAAREERLSRSLSSSCAPLDGSRCCKLSSIFCDIISSVSKAREGTANDVEFDSERVTMKVSVGGVSNIKQAVIDTNNCRNR